MTTTREGTVPFRGHNTWYKLVGEPTVMNGKLPLLVLHGGPGLPHDYHEDLALLRGRCSTNSFRPWLLHFLTVTSWTRFATR